MRQYLSLLYINRTLVQQYKCSIQLSLGKIGMFTKCILYKLQFEQQYHRIYSILFQSVYKCTLLNYHSCWSISLYIQMQWLYQKMHSTYDTYTLQYNNHFTFVSVLKCRSYTHLYIFFLNRLKKRIVSQTIGCTN